MPFVHAAEVTLEVHLLVNPNVLLVLIVRKIKHAVIRSALILVLELVDLMPNVKLLTTAQYAVVHPTMWVILLLDAY